MRYTGDAPNLASDLKASSNRSFEAPAFRWKSDQTEEQRSHSSLAFLTANKLACCRKKSSGDHCIVRACTQSQMVTSSLTGILADASNSF